MSTVIEPVPARTERQTAEHVEPRILLYAVDWQTYEKFLDAVGSRPLRLTYDRGNLELMSPLPIHEIYKTLFGRLFDMLTEEVGLRIKALGHTTFRRRDVDRGLEADAVFYLANIPHVQDWSRIDLNHDPPPDLAIEVDITRSSLDRMSIYAELGVPEVWRCQEESVQVYQLGPDGKYEPCSRSLALPYLPLEELLPLLRQSTLTEDGELLRLLRAWIRDRVVPLWRAWQATLPSIQ